MATRELKNEEGELQDPSQDSPLDQIAQPQQPNSIQLPVSEPMQMSLTDVILDDFHEMDNFRKNRDSDEAYGTTGKGDTLTFDAWIKHLSHLYTGWREAKTVPWKFCSNRSLRIGTAILEMMHSRLLGAIWNEDLTRWKPGEETDTPKVERIEKFMNWWIRAWSPMKDFFDNWVKYIAGFGDGLTEISWQVDEDVTNETEDIPITDEGGNPLMNESGQPATQLMNKIFREERTKTTLFTKDQVYMMKGARNIEKDPLIIEEEILYKDLLKMEALGQAVNVTDKLEKLLIVKMPAGATTPEERERIRNIKLRNVPVRVLRWYGHYDVEGSGVDESVRLMVVPQFRIYLGGVRVRDLTKSGKRPIDFTMYNTYADKINEMLGQGVLDQVRELSDELDAIFNQITDANTLSVLKPWFYDPNGDLDAEVLQLAPNKGTPVTNPSQNVYFPPFEINTDRLLNSARMVMEFIERLTAASNFVMGKEGNFAGGSGTATRTQAIVQSAEIRFSRPVERMKLGAGRIMTKMLDVIQLNIQPGMESRVLGEKGQRIFGENELTDQGISGKFDAWIGSDPSMGSKQTERDLNSIFYSLLLQNPIVATDPTKIYKVTADLLKSFGKDPIEYLGPAPSSDDIDSPEDENTLLVQGDFKRVRAQFTENHMEHIQKHQEFLNSPTLQELAKSVPVLVQQIVQTTMLHIQEHEQFFQAFIQLIAQTTKGGQGGAPGNNGAVNGKGPTGTGNDSKQRVENTPGPAADALSAQRNGKVGSVT